MVDAREKHGLLHVCDGTDGCAGGLGTEVTEHGLNRGPAQRHGLSFHGGDENIEAHGWACTVLWFTMAGLGEEDMARLCLGWVW
ncbi:hypothetical protein M0R45_016723 [Rubus argutus]|uniref:Uncharacterized protein n=1 Tax=Rubus argutus TaxID=59490 RepID=A0AAW1XW28_RUBAR